MPWRTHAPTAPRVRELGGDVLLYTYGTYWSQRISASIVAADARRCLRRLPGLARAALEGVAPRRRGRAA